MFIFRLLSAAFIAFTTFTTQAYAVEKQIAQKTLVSTLHASKLDVSLMVTNNLRPMTTQDDIAKQLLGPSLMRPLAENHSK